MRLHFFSIPVHHGSEADELNRFLASHRVVSVERQLVQDGASSMWAVCVCFLDGEPAAPPVVGKSRVDYREVLSAPDFAIYAKLRSLRKELSEREGVPAFALFTNEQLAAMVTTRVTSLAALQQIDGVGPARIEKYGAAFLDVLKANLQAPGEAREAGKDQSG